MTFLPPTADDTIGPYFPPCFAQTQRIDLRSPYPGLNVAAQGKPIKIVGRLLDTLNNVTGDCSLIDVWQANANGVFARPSNESDPRRDSFFSGFGRICTLDGTFEIDTVLPGAVVNGEVTRAPHITLTFFCDGFNRLVTQIFFDDVDGNQNDPLLRSMPAEVATRLLARRVEERDGVVVYELVIKFRGENETPFFDDLLS